MKYAFMQAHHRLFRLTSMCRVMKVHRSGYYAWLREPLSARGKANEKLTTQIREFYDQSMLNYKDEWETKIDSLRSITISNFDELLYKSRYFNTFLGLNFNV